MMPVSGRSISLLLACVLLAGCAGGAARLPAPVESRTAQARLPQVIGQGASSQQPAGQAVAEPAASAAAPSAAAPRAMPLQSEPAPDLRPIDGEPAVGPAPPEAGEALAMLSPAPAATPAVDALLRQARAQWQAGELQQATATLERALRIDPYSPYLWQHLAALRLADGRPDLAAQLAAKSNSYAGSNRPVLLRNWRIIAEARRQRGDIDGARAAEARAAGYAEGAP